MRRLPIYAVVVFALAGCAAPSGPIFSQDGSGKLWPPSPDPPRIRYLGQIAGAADLKPPVTTGQAFRKAISGSSPVLQLTCPYNIAVSEEEKVFVTDAEAGGLFIFDLRARTTQLIRTVGSEAFEKPSGVAIGGQRVYVSDTGRQRVFVLDHEGQFVADWGRDDLQRPSGVAFCEKNGHLYVIDVASHVCVVFDREGNIIHRFGERGSDPGNFNYPLQITCSSEFGLMITDTLNFRVQRFDLDGSFIAAFGQKGDGAGDFALPKGVAIDPSGRFLVVDSQFENIQLFQPDGQLLLAFGHEGQGPGEFWLPSGICIDPLNRVWVADTYNRRLQVFEFVTGDVQ
jgi:DNA-binding beta-propeller fold protein YncE